MLPNGNVIYCFGRRGLTEIVAESGDGLHFELWDGHGWQDHFFWNVGQPQQDPPCHPCHKDDPGVCGAIRVSAAAFRPFHAKYTLLGENSFEWIQNGDGLFLRASTVDPVRFHRVTAGARQIKERALVLSGVDLGREYRGRIHLALSVGELSADILSSRCCSLPEATNLCNPAEAALFFNISQSPLLANTFYMPVNKTWHSFMGRIFGLSAETNLLLFAWDGALSAAALSHFDPALARRCFLSLLEGLTSDGRLPQFRLGTHFSNRSNPPVWFLAADEIYEHTGDRNFVAEVFLPLLLNYRWFKRHRMNADFTFSWGTDNEDNAQLLRVCGKAGAVHESGLDNSPLFDEMELQDGKLDFACIDLSCLMYRACEVLLRFTTILGRDDAAKSRDELELDSARFRCALRDFFSAEQGMVNSFRRRNGARVYARTLTPLCFYPLLTNMLDAAEVDLLVHLFRSSDFTGSAAMLPSLSFNDPRFDGDGDYWRGRIWPPLIYLTAKGFKGWAPSIYSEIRSWARSLLECEWQRDCHVHENYSAVSGRGEPHPGVYARSCPMYSWGALLGVV